MFNVYCSIVYQLAVLAHNSVCVLQGFNIVRLRLHTFCNGFYGNLTVTLDPALYVINRTSIRNQWNDFRKIYFEKIK